MLTNNEPYTLVTETTAQKMLSDFLLHLDHAYKGRVGGMPLWLDNLDAIDSICLQEALEKTLESNDLRRAIR